MKYQESEVISITKKVRKVQGVPQSQTAALPRPQEEEETDKSKQAQTEQINPNKPEALGNLNSHNRYWKMKYKMVAIGIKEHIKDWKS